RPMRGMKDGRSGVPWRKPGDPGSPERAVAGGGGHRCTPGNGPGGVTPVESAAGSRRQTNVGTQVSDESEIYGHGGAGTAAAATLSERVSSRGRISEQTIIDEQRRGAADDRHPALELVDAEVDPRPGELSEGRLDSVPCHQFAKITVLAACPSQQSTIGTGRVLVDRAPQELEEISLPSFQARAKGRPCVGHAPW